VNLVGDLTAREVGLKVLAGEAASIDTTTANGRLVFAMASTRAARCSGRSATPHGQA
jgi:DNA invertase Pin-like site-specific DNA recombinase